MLIFRALNRICLCALLLGCSQTFPAAAAQPALARFALTDYLGRDWQNELVFFKADPGLATRKDLVLLDGKQQPVPFQWSHENGSEIAFLATVPRFGRVEYTLAPGGVRPPAGSLKFRKTSTHFELTNGQTGLRVHSGSEALRSGPIAGIQLTSGKWIGSGELQWPARPLHYDVKVLAEGPAFADLESSYTLTNDHFWRIRFRVVAGEPVVLVDEHFTGPADARYDLKLGAGFEPHHLLWRKGAGTATETLETFRGAFVLEPWLQWWRGWQGNWMALYRDDSPDLLAIGLREAASWIEPEKTKWDTRVHVNATATLPFQLQGFQRKWMLMTLPKEVGLKGITLDVGPAPLLDGRPLGRGDTRGAPQLSSDSAPVPQQYLIKYGDVPLNRIKDYVLEWPDANLRHPRLFATEAELDQFRAHFKVNADRLAALRETPPRTYELDDHVGYLLATHDSELLERVTKFAREQLQTAVDLYVRQVHLPTQGADAPRHYGEVAPALNAIDAALMPGGLSPDQKQRVRAQLAFLGYTLADPSVWSPEREFSANPSMTTCMRSMLGVLACLIPDHPQAKTWADIAIREMAEELQTWAGPNGEWVESPHYTTVAMDAIVPLAIALRQTTFTTSNWALDLKLRSTVRWLAVISTPRDPRLNGQRHLPEIGNTYTGERTCLPGWFARLWKDRDPRFAAQMQWCWREQGSVLKPGIGGGYPGVIGYSHLMFDPSVPAEPPDWKSELFPWAGAALRTHFPGDCETFLYHIQGPSHAHYDEDEGSFILWGKGQPLCEDFGYGDGGPASDHSRVHAASNPALQGRGEIQEFVTSTNADYLHGQVGPWRRQILFVKDKDCLGPNYFVVRDTVKDIAQRDGTIQKAPPSDWRVWLATDTAPATDSSQPIRVSGLFGVDLVIYFANPSPGVLSTETVTRTNAASGLQNRARTQRSLRLPLQPNSTVTAILYPVMKDQPTPRFSNEQQAGGNVVKIESSFGTDYVLVGWQPFDFKQDDITFRGRAGTIQVRPAGVELSLLSPGELRYKDQLLTKVEAAKPALTAKPASAPAPDGRLPVTPGSISPGSRQEPSPGASPEAGPRLPGEPATPDGRRNP